MYPEGALLNSDATVGWNPLEHITIKYDSLATGAKKLLLFMGARQGFRAKHKTAAILQRAHDKGY